MLFLFITIGTVVNGCKISDTGLSTTPYGPDGELFWPVTSMHMHAALMPLLAFAARPLLSCQAVDIPVHCVTSNLFDARGVTTVPRGPSQCDAVNAGVLVCPLTNARVVEIALVFGFSIATLVYCSASFSGERDEPTSSCRPELQEGIHLASNMEVSHACSLHPIHSSRHNVTSPTRRREMVRILNLFADARSDVALSRVPRWSPEPGGDPGVRDHAQDLGRACADVFHCPAGRRHPGLRLRLCGAPAEAPPRNTLTTITTLSKFASRAMLACASAWHKW